MGIPGRGRGTNSCGAPFTAASGRVPSPRCENLSEGGAWSPWNMWDMPAAPLARWAGSRDLARNGFPVATPRRPAASICTRVLRPCKVDTPSSPSPAISDAAVAVDSAVHGRAGLGGLSLERTSSPVPGLAARGRDRVLFLFVVVRCLRTLRRTPDWLDLRSLAAFARPRCAHLRKGVAAS